MKTELNVNNCTWVSLTHVIDERGDLGVVEVGSHIDFDIKRMYYLYNTQTGKQRGMHAHKELRQLFIPVNGEFELTLDDGVNSQTILLSNPAIGLYVKPMLWRSLNNFTENAVCLVLASDIYKESDYIREYSEFLKCVKS